MKTEGNRRTARLVCALIGFLLTGFLWTNAFAAGPEYPTRAITMVVPYPPGGVTDLAARTLAEAMERQLKHPVTVMNKVGGATTVGGYTVSSSKPDGYTIGFFPPAAAIPEAFAYFQEAPYSSKDIKPISSVSAVVQTLAVQNDAPWNSLKELVEYARKHPGIKVSTGGKQTVPHMFLTTLNKMDKTGFIGVPFAGDAPNLTALLGGHVTVGIMDYTVLKPLVEAKKLRLLAVVTSEKRVDFVSAVPTAVELGYPVVFLPILGVVGPKGIPEEIVAKLDSVVAKICAEPDFQAKMRNIPLQINNQNSAAYEKSLTKFKDNILAFFREEGLVK
jgi:tripartite-type tricarboxylate transporter receptor subunit TctC